MKLITRLTIGGLLVAFLALANDWDRDDRHKGPPSPTPEPTTVVLIGGGLLGLTLIARRHSKK